MLRPSRQKHLRRILWALIFLFILGTFSSGGVIWAQEGDDGETLGGQKFGGLDLVFLIDQSGSMRDNDPRDIRIDTVEWILQNLGIDNLKTRPGAKHRIAVIGFGTDAELYTNQFESLKTTSKADWDDRFADIEQKIGPENLKNTDPLTALVLVHDKLFDKTEGNADRDINRTKGIIILTDGPPYIQGWREIKDENGNPIYGGNFYDSYFKIMRDYIDENLPIATEARDTDGYHIWMFGFNQGGDPGILTDWASQEASWERVLNVNRPGGEEIDRVRGFSTFESGANAAAMLEVLDTIMIGGVCDQRLGEGEDDLPCIVPELFDVPPYLREARFTIFLPTDTTRVQILDPDGDEPAWEETEVFGPFIEELVEIEPTPGVWEWLQNNSASGLAKVKFTPDFVAAELVEPQAEQDLFDTVKLRIQLVSEDGSQMRELPEYPIQASAVVEAPDKVSREFPLISDGSGNLVSENSLSLDQPGEYTVYVSGQTTFGDDKVLKLFQKVPLKFNVGSLVPELVAPVGDVSKYHETPIQVDITKPNGDPPDGSTRDAIDIEFKLIWPDDSKHDMPVTVNGSSYVAKQTLVPNQNGNYEVHATGTMQVGDQTVEVFDSTLPFFVDGLVYAITAPTDEQPQHGETQIELKLDNQQGDPYKEDKAVPWEISVRAIDPNGVDDPGSPYTMTPAGPGLYMTTFKPAVAGDWELVASAEVTLPDGSKEIVFEDVRHTFPVYPTSRVTLQVLSPTSTDKQNIRNAPKIIPIPESIIGTPTDSPFRVRVVDDNGDPIPISDLGPNASTVVDTFLSGPENYGSLVKLSTNPNNPSELMADLGGLTAAGDYTFTAEFGDLNREYEPENKKAAVIVFKRTDPFAAVTIGLLVAEILLLLLIIFLIFRFFKVRVNPVLGSLEFGSNTSRGRSLGSIMLGSYGKNSFSVNQKTIMANVDPAVSEVIKKLKIKQGSSDESLGDDDFGYGGGASIRVTAWGPDGEKFMSDEDLPEGIQPPIGDGSIYIAYHKE